MPQANFNLLQQSDEIVELLGSKAHLSMQKKSKLAIFFVKYFCNGKQQIDKVMEKQKHCYSFKIQ